MKKGRLLLTILCLLSVIGGALAYKSSRNANIFYLDTTTIQGGTIHSICSITTTYTLIANPAGNRTIKAATIALDMTCPVISVIPSF